MYQALLIGCGGFIGSIARYLLSTFVTKTFGMAFPYGTLTVNVIGCFLIGVISVLTEERVPLDPTIRLLLTVGVLGGFTTFSSFGYETMTLWRLGASQVAMINVAVSVVTGLLAVWLGGVVARMV